MMDLKVYTLEDGKDYLELYTIKDNDNTYILLIEENNLENICFRKVVLKDNVECLDVLENNEFDIVYEKFKQEFKELFD